MITLLCVVDRHRHALLPQFVAHYRALGVQRFLLSCHLEPGLGFRKSWRILMSMAGELHRLGIPDMPVFEAPYDAMAAMAHRVTVRNDRCSPDDWIVWADIDEFQEYGRTLPEVIAECEARGHSAVRGWMVDHFAPDGALAHLDPHRSIWEQYPSQGAITRDLAGGVDSKIVLTRWHVTPAPGCHAIPDAHGQWSRGSTGGVPTSDRDAIVHHFKWDAGVTDRLKERLTDDWKRRCPWWIESARILEFVQHHGGVLEREAASA